ncbi:MAG: Uma2 family endonuclease [Saprospiraceae bacterium]|nr:Uma2 family endonuclease [Saprospiraceae bacterium]MCF8252041.1 Uma2 family endonuclease [Saprospiraceae bacterium]MCF8281730.1 Uma2 family endonuclease [Bacteroidales bacterium]MCF8310382.1 Uma2 family endonuclease [Saprospiraceae bacterium]MCF8439760.1 Uma2 family endonuclease [Saprospiraceae bacterium]
MIATSILPEARRATLEEYFEHELASESKHEFINGQITPMAYTSDNHGLIATNFSAEIRQIFKKHDGRVYAGDRMVFSPFCNEIYYPDIVVVKGQPEFYQYKGNMRATLNPTILVEVLSDSTEEHDRNGKWPCYREIKSLQQFFLVSQHEPSVEYYTRMEDGSSRWIYTYANNLDAGIPIGGEEVSLREIYALVNWQQQA